MEKNNKVSGCCTTHRVEILGVILLAIATVLTLYTLSGAGIFGMFLVGLVFCTHQHFGCRKCGCNCDCGPSSEETECSYPKKVTAARKKTKKTV